jgi:membrane associated rhomboid family serine protease
MIPYRAKNPSEIIPYATITLLVLNVAIYPFSRLFPVIDQATSPFQSANLCFLVGNGLFLWIFGPAVEGRLGAFKLVMLYLLAGFLGGFSSLGLARVLKVEPAILGAGGAVLSVMGASLYLFPFARVRVWPSMSWLRFVGGDDELGADWLGLGVVFYYLFLSALCGALTLNVGVLGSVLPLGGLSGALLGFLFTLALREPRDSEEASEAQSLRADVGGDYSILAMHELEALIERDPHNAELILMFCRKALIAAVSNAESRAESVNYSAVREMFVKKAQVLIGCDEPELVARMALNLASEPGAIPATALLRLGGRLESQGDYELAEQLYHRVFLHDPRGRDGELALIRKAHLTEQSHSNKHEAAKLYIDLLQRFPNGMQATYAQDALRRLGVAAPTVTAASTSAHEAVPIAASSVPDGVPAIPTSAVAHGLRSIGG